MDPKTNVEVVTELMEFSKYGALSQVFIIEALRFYSEKVTQAGEPKDDPLSLISPVAWYNVAKEINDTLKAKYEPNTN